MGLTAHEVHRQIGVVLPAVSAAVEDRPKRQAVRLDLVQIAVACVALIFGADVPVQALVPLDDVIRVAQIHDVVVVELPAVGIGRRVKIEDCRSGRVDLVGHSTFCWPLQTRGWARLAEFGS